MSLNWTLKHVCEINWYDLSHDCDRKFVDDPNCRPFILLIGNDPESLVKTLKFLITEGCSYEFLDMVIDAYNNKCSSVVLK